jgi:hypothetical protein
VNRIDGITTNMGNQSWRAGWRLGVEYPVLERSSVGLLYTLTEWSSENANAWNWPGYVDPNTTPTFIDGVNPSKPAYFTVYMNYRF